MSNATVSMRVRIVSAALALVTCAAVADDQDSHARQSYHNQVLVSNGALPANFVDPNLVNGWGVAFNPQGFVWVSAEDTGKATLYDGTGSPQTLVVTIPGPNGEMGHPTGIVFSGGTDFIVGNGTTNGPSRFIFATENGTIAGWAPNVNALNAFTAVDNSDAEALYTGLALGGNGETHLLYAANFRGARIEVFDGTFKAVQVDGGFVDTRLPQGYAPFGVQAINGDIYVTYAKQDETGEEEVQGPGRGFVDVFDPDGHLIRRVASRGVLNAPWGSRSRPPASASSVAHCWSAISATARSTPSVRVAASCWEHCMMPTIGACASTDSGASLSATASPHNRPTRCSMPPDRTTKKTAPTASSP